MRVRARSSSDGFYGSDGHDSSRLPNIGVTKSRLKSFYIYITRCSPMTKLDSGTLRKSKSAAFVSRVSRSVSERVMRFPVIKQHYNYKSFIKRLTRCYRIRDPL